MATPGTGTLPKVRDAGTARARHILILDDEPALQRLLRVILEGEGHTVTTTDDGRHALDLVAAQRVDLIIQDLRMPKMDGLTFLRLLKERHPDVPSIVLTAFATFETAVEAMRLGAYTHLQKPFDTEELRKIVARALERLEIVKKAPRVGLQISDIISNTALMTQISPLINRVAATAKAARAKSS